MKTAANKNVTLGTALALLLSLAPAAGAQEGLSSEGVRRAVQQAVTHMRTRQEADGTWPRRGHEGGMTALTLLAMINAGVPPEDPDVTRGLRALADVADERTYVVSLKAQAYAAAYDAAAEDNPNRAAYLAEVRGAAGWLVEAQLDNGMWGYSHGGRRTGRGDNSNTQFALLGLHEAAKLRVDPPGEGVAVPRETWERSRTHFENTQCRDGGWHYHGIRDTGYGSMTAAGIASLYITGMRLHVGGRHEFVDGAYPDCGRYAENVVLAKGLEWMNENFTVRTNPGKGRWHHYYLYAMERVGMISGLRTFGRHDWYRQGAGFLIGSQNRDGSWGGAQETPFAALFLAKGNRPVLIQKLQWRGTEPNAWNRNIHDLENLTTFLGEKLGRPVTWQTATLDLPLSELRVSPILYVTGHEFPKFTDEEKAKLRQYVHSGGTLLFEACCGKESFAEGFRALAREVWPEYRVRNLVARGPDKHPVWDSYYRYERDFEPVSDLIDGNYGLQGIDVGCRTSVFFATRALSCLWELQDIPKWSDFAYMLGTNIAAYATGREQLANRLDAVDLPAEEGEGERIAEIPRGAIRIARIIHDGDYKADPHAMTNLAKLLREKAKVDVVSRARHLHPRDDALFEYPVVFMNGHHTFELPPEDIAGLRKYLERGGVLIASNCCGRTAFDRSFRGMVLQLFPEGAADAEGEPIELQDLPADHPLYEGKVGVPLGRVHYRDILARELKKAGVEDPEGTKRPPIEAVTIDGRTVILYSKYDFCCALEGDHPYACRGYTDEDGKRLAMDLFLYAISY